MRHMKRLRENTIRKIVSDVIKQVLNEENWNKNFYERQMEQLAQSYADYCNKRYGYSSNDMSSYSYPPTKEGYEVCKSFPSLGLYKVSDKTHSQYNLYRNYRPYSLVSDEWYDDIDDEIYMGSYFLVRKGKKYAFINKKNEKLYNTWFDKIKCTYEDEYPVKVCIGNKWNLLSDKGTFMFNQWFDKIRITLTGSVYGTIRGKEYLIKKAV